MKKGRIIIITGSPGTGKSTISSILAKESNMSKSVNMQTDDFYHYLSKGAIPPYLPESCIGTCLPEHPGLAVERNRTGAHLREFLQDAPEKSESGGRDLGSAEKVQCLCQIH